MFPFISFFYTLLKNFIIHHWTRTESNTLLKFNPIESTEYLPTSCFTRKSLKILEKVKDADRKKVCRNKSPRLVANLVSHRKKGIDLLSVSLSLSLFLPLSLWVDLTRTHLRVLAYECTRILTGRVGGAKGRPRRGPKPGN